MMNENNSTLNQDEQEKEEIKDKKLIRPKFSEHIDPWDREIPHRTTKHNYQDSNWEDWDDERR